MKRLLRSVGGQTLVQLVGIVITQLAAFLYVVVAARELGPGTLARTQVVMTLIVLLSIPVRLGLDEGLAYQIPRLTGGAPRSVRRMAMYALMVSLGLTAVVAVAMVLAAGPLERLLRLAGLAGDLRFVWPMLPALTALVIGASVLRGVGRADLMSLLVTYVFPILLIAFVALGLRGGLTVREVYAARMAALALPAVLAVALAFSIRGEPARFDAADRRQLHAFSLASMGVVLTQYLVEQSDAIVGAFLLSSSELGRYIVAAKLAAVAGSLPAAMAFVVGPALAAAHAGPRLERALELHGAASRWILRVNAVLLGALIALRADVLHLFGPHYASAASMFAILAAAQIVASALGLNAPALMARGRQKAELAISVAVIAMFWLGSALVAPIGGAPAMCVVLGTLLCAGNALRLFVLGADGRRGWATRDTALLVAAVLAALTVLTGTLVLAPGPGGGRLAAGVVSLAFTLLLLMPPLRRAAVADLRALLQS